MITTAPATREMFSEFYEGMNEVSVKAIALKKDGKVIAIGGSYIKDGAVIIFMKATDEARKKYPKSLFSAAKRFLESKRGMVLAKCDINIDGADRFLKHLGFEHIGGDVWRGLR